MDELIVYIVIGIIAIPVLLIGAYLRKCGFEGQKSMVLDPGNEIFEEGMLEKGVRGHGPFYDD